MNQIMKRASWVVSKATFVVCLFLTVDFAVAEVERVRNSNTAVLEFVNKLSALPKIDPTEIGNLLGKQLSPDPSMPGAFIAHDIPFEDATIEFLDYRGAGLLAIKLKKERCIARTKILADYEPLKVTSRPTGHSPEEQVYYTRPEKWRELSFGFPENSPECLKTIVFSMKS